MLGQTPILKNTPKPNLLSPADKANQSLGRPTGRITAEQIETLDRMGVAWEKMKGWTKYKAQCEILKRR